MVPVPLAEHVATSSCCSGLILRSGAPPGPPSPATPHRSGTLFSAKAVEAGGALHTGLLELQTGSPTPSGAFQRLPLSCAAVRALPATPTRGSRSIPPSSPAGRSAHTGAPARGRAGGGGRCCRCRSPSPSLRARPPCCGLCSRLLLSLWPKPSRASRRSSRGEGDTARRRGTAGSGKPGSEQGAPAAGRRQPSSLAQSLLQPLPRVPGSEMPLFS